MVQGYLVASPYVNPVTKILFIDTVTRFTRC